MPFAAREVTLAVIAGGHGTRMGLAKAKLRVGDQSILAWQLARLGWRGPTMLVTAPATRNPPDAELFDRECVDAEENAGPLRGILTALEHCDTPLVAMVAVDMPHVNGSMLRWLVETLERQAAWQGVMFRVPADDGQGIEPFPSVFRKSATRMISQRLADGKRSIRALCDLPDFQAIDAPSSWPADVWTNLNEPNQLEQFLKQPGVQH
jgi:molybdopterin-guanine dinucleotide biosynthesis protein A